MPVKRTPEQDAEFTKLYLDENVTIAEIREKLGISPSGVQSLVKRLGLQRRSPDKTRKYFINHSAFSSVESNPDAAYFLGLLLTDGTLNKKTNTVTLAQCGERNDVVYKFQKFLNTVKPVCVTERPNYDKFNLS